MGVGKASSSGRFLAPEEVSRRLGEQENLRSVGGSEVSEKSHGLGGENPGLVSGVWRVGEGTGLGSLGGGMVSRRVPICEV